MRRNSLRRSAISSLTQKVKAPQHLLRLKDEGDDEGDDEWSGRFRLPSLPRQKWKDDDVPSNGNSAATSVSWSQEVESVATQKLEEQWATVERTLYEEDELQLLQESVLDECMQWRTQIPYLRIVGRNPACVSNRAQRDVGSSDKRTKRPDSQTSNVFAERKLSMKEGEDSVEYKVNKAKFEDVLDMMMEYVVSELFPNEKSDTSSLHDDLSDALRIAPAPVHGNRNSSRNSKVNWTEEAISPNYIENKSLSIRTRLLDTESSLQTIKNNANHQGVQKKSRNSISANKPRDFSEMKDNDVLKSKERLCTPHIGRNKLGTVFNERIVVSPVPFTVSTRESFSTLKTVPIKFMNENLEICSYKGSARNIGFQGSARKSGALRNLNIHSAWQAPVSPTVWPKNIRLAPIDTSRLPSNRNRSLAPSPAVLHCSRKPLSPISRSALPKSAHTTSDRSGDFLAIQGRHIVPPQSKIGLLSAGWDCSPRMVKSKKKARAKERL